MAFAVHVADSVTEYMRGRDRLTPSDQDRILTGIVDELSERADAFLQRNPHPYLPDRFWYDYVLMTEAHEIRAFRFACGAEGHVYGVTAVLYVEEWPADAE
jgi:hypothetical protein